MVHTRNRLCAVLSMIALLMAPLTLLSCRPRAETVTITAANTDTSADTVQAPPLIHEYRISSKICKFLFDMYPEKFCKTKGMDTLLENGYTDAFVTSDQFLILRLTNSQLEAWKNSDVYLQILQKMVGEEKQIVSQIIPPTDLVYGTLYEGADLSGWEIAEDYTTINVGPGIDRSYIMVVPRACLMMQVLSGRPSEEISVDYYEIDVNGNVYSHIVFPISSYIFQNFEECKQLMTYEQIPSTIVEYEDAKTDEKLWNLKYKTFWGMRYQSSELEYEIFAYEFADKDDTLKYFNNASGSLFQDPLPIAENDPNMNVKKIVGEDTYQVIVTAGTKAYRLICSRLLMDQIEEMLSIVFSVKV